MKLLVRFLLILLCIALAATVFCVVLFSDRRPELCRAIERGDTNYVSQYVASGGDVNASIVSERFARNKHMSLLNIAIGDQQSIVVDLLLRGGADPNRTDSTGYTPLLTAASSGQPEIGEETSSKIVKMLLKAGADPNLKASSEYEYTPLLEAASLGRSNMVILLIGSGANVNATNGIGQTALHLTRNAEVAQLLIAAGSDPLARANGETPADSALRLGNFSVLKVITNAVPDTR